MVRLRGKEAQLFCRPEHFTFNRPMFMLSVCVCVFVCVCVCVWQGGEGNPTIMKCSTY